jgi:hypothetical protein
MGCMRNAECGSWIWGVVMYSWLGEEWYSGGEIVCEKFCGEDLGMA